MKAILLKLKKDDILSLSKCANREKFIPNDTYLNDQEQRFS